MIFLKYYKIINDYYNKYHCLLIAELKCQIQIIHLKNKWIKKH